MLKRILVLVATAAVAGVGATAGHAGARTAFLCYSKWQVDPGVWSFTTSLRHIDAKSLYAQGYWSPYAEKSVPTKTMLPGGWYLICNLGQPAIAPTALQVVSGTYLDNLGRAWAPGNPLYRAIFPGGTGKAGYYPVAQ